MDRRTITLAILAIGAGILGFWYIKKRGSSGSSPGTAQPGTPQFTQAQEVQDFQIFSALTGQQQASDLNFLSEVAGLFAGGSSTGTPGGGTAPPSTGGVPPSVQQAYNTGVQGALSGPGTAPQDAALARAISSAPPGQQGDVRNFFLWNQANQQAGYDYYSPTGLVQTPLGVAPGEP